MPPKSSLPIVYDTPPAAALHTCPYLEEIKGDDQTLCDCDEEDTEQCARDI